MAASNTVLDYARN